MPSMIKNAWLAVAAATVALTPAIASAEDSALFETRLHVDRAPLPPQALRAMLRERERRG